MFDETVLAHSDYSFWMFFASTHYLVWLYFISIYSNWILSTLCASASKNVAQSGVDESNILLCKTGCVSGCQISTIQTRQGTFSRKKSYTLACQQNNVIGQNIKRHKARRRKGKWYYKLYYPHEALIHTVVICKNMICTTRRHPWHG
jgi:hypothetical protein